MATDLPEDVLRIVFRQLDVLELARLTLVCSKWQNVIVGSPELYTSISTVEICKKHDVVLGIDTLLQLVARGHKHVRRLNLAEVASQVNVELLSLIAGYAPNVTHLSIDFAEDMSGHVDGCLLMFGELQELHAQAIPNPFSQFLGQAPKPWSRLRALDLWSSSFFNEQARVLASCCTCLEELNLDNQTRLSEAAVCAMIDASAACMHALYLDGADCSLRLMEAVGRCHELKKLSIVFCNDFDDQGSSHFCNLRQLEWLKLRKVANMSAAALMPVVRHWQHLTRLDLTECNHIDDQCLSVVAAVCVKLEVVALAWCWRITDDGLIVMSDACSKMRYLDLSGVKLITDRFLQHLYTAMPMPGLTDLILASVNHPTDEGLMQLAVRRPKLSVFNYYGFKVQTADSTSTGDAWETEHAFRDVFSV